MMCPVLGGKMLINVLTWIGLGIVAGFLVYVIVPGQRKFLAGTISAGIVGAFVGGIIYSALKIGSIAATLDPWAAGLAVLGAAVMIYLIYTLVQGESGVPER